MLAVTSEALCDNVDEVTSRDAVVGVLGGILEITGVLVDCEAIDVAMGVAVWVIVTVGVEIVKPTDGKSLTDVADVEIVVSGDDDFVI